MTQLSKQSISGLQERISGHIVLPDGPDYENERSLWNAMIQRRPSAIVKCMNQNDVSAALLFAREQNLEISIRGAGHNIAGNALADEGLAIDLGNMKSVHVDVAAKLARVEPGATLADFDAAVQPFGLATPVGINSTTGIAGLTLGGGFGWLTRQYGLTIDSLVGAELVGAEGQTLRASNEENRDLFWAIRGGGGNFGIVTRFEFRLHQVGPDILAGLVVFSLSQAEQVLKRYRDFIETAPEELNVWVVMRKAPPLPFLPESMHGKEVVVLPVFFSGQPDKAESLLESIRSFGEVVGEHVALQPYVQWQQAFDPLLTPGARNYWKSHNFTALSDSALTCMIEYAANLPYPECEIFVGYVGGAANQVPSETTAYAHRDAKFVLNVHGRWRDPADDETCIAWARAFFNASKPYASAGGYVNFMTEDEAGRVANTYGSNYGRLREIKQRYDPENAFHLNHNIEPLRRL